MFIPFLILYFLLFPLLYVVLLLLIFRGWAALTNLTVFLLKITKTLAHGTHWTMCRNCHNPSQSAKSKGLGVTLFCCATTTHHKLFSATRHPIELKFSQKTHLTKTHWFKLKSIFLKILFWIVAKSSLTLVCCCCVALLCLFNVFPMKYELKLDVTCVKTGDRNMNRKQIYNRVLKKHKNKPEKSCRNPEQ